MAPNILSIPPGKPFLKTLAEGLLAGRIVEGFRHDGDPLSLADVTIYVPSRRAARSLGAAFTDALSRPDDRGGMRSAILPRIRPLGEGDEATIFAAQDMGGTGALPAMPELERRLNLARLARAWRHLADRVGRRRTARRRAGADHRPPRNRCGWPAISARFSTRSRPSRPPSPSSPISPPMRWPPGGRRRSSFLEIVTRALAGVSRRRGASPARPMPRMSGCAAKPRGFWPAARGGR